MTISTALQFRFTPAQQEFFASVSADVNPMHMSSVAARRTQSGRTVVHGIHEVVRAMDLYASANSGLPLPTKIAVRFPNPVYVGDTVEIVRLDAAAPQLRLQVQVDGTVTADLRIVLGTQTVAASAAPAISVERVGACRELSLSEMRGRTGSVRSGADLAEITKNFPAASAWIGAQRVAALIALSRLVGMECPGLHSLFSGFSVELRDDAETSLTYRVASADERFRLLNIEVSGLGIQGSVEAFARHPPIPQPTMDQLASSVKADEFAGHRVLIIGGSRGLGELTAKLIAAGGGDPIITFAVGREDAERVAADIQKAGRKCTVISYDVRQPAAPQLQALVEPITHLYYYATGQIFGRRTREYDSATFAEFLQFYVDGFYDACVSLRKNSTSKLSVFYPSSVAVEQRPRNMTEYSMAKAAAELLCSDLNRAWPNVHITSVRLPRLLTDQTSTVAPVESASTIDTILPIVRTVQGHRFG
jgi:NAD(P)-dependent dehydrogenase (short-subunit alcohol dehydrogenase family)/acyl dehydratase